MLGKAFTVNVGATHILCIGIRPPQKQYGVVVHVFLFTNYAMFNPNVTILFEEDHLFSIDKLVTRLLENKIEYLHPYRTIIFICCLAYGFP